MRRFVTSCALLALSLLPGAMAAAAAAPEARPMPATTTVTPGKPVVTQVRGRIVVTAAERVDAPLTSTAGQAASPAGRNAFTCTYNVAQSYTYTGPTMQYWSETDCSKGTPIRNVTVLQSAHVNTPSVFTTVASQPDECDGANPCESPHHDYDPAATELLQDCAEPVVKGTDGVLYDLGPYCFSVPYNNNGAGYPVAPAYAQFPIPFPGPSYQQFTTRDTNFLAHVEAYYTQQGLPFPSCAPGDAINAHHIKPISFGGDNTIGGLNNNAVLLCASDHQPYTSWWGRPGVGPFVPS